MPTTQTQKATDADVITPVVLTLYRPQVLKHSDTFLVLDHFGDAEVFGPNAEGLFHEDTRHLSFLSLLVDGQRPLLLSSTVSRDNAVLAVDLTAPALHREGGRVLPRDTVHIRRTKVLGNGACHERIELRNYGGDAARFTLSLQFGADFADLFEVRGERRPHRGDSLPAEIGENTVTLRYRGLDEITRHTRLAFSPRPVRCTAGEVQFEVVLPAKGATAVSIATICSRDAVQSTDRGYDALLENNRSWTRRRRREVAEIRSSNDGFNDWLDRARADIDMLATETPDGLYPYAGTPWFSTAFGRDGLITALQCLWVDPALARGTLTFLAAHQATALDPARDAEPGKILHETRKGEMAALGEVPFGLYYGSVDATPLFVLLAAAYYDRTGDLALIRAIWPNVEAALAWMDTYGDPDGDGFLEYARKPANGLRNQGWKDSDDSIFHDDGRLAEPPIALVEVQAYAYAALSGAARLAAALDLADRAGALSARAETLRERFEATFWCEDIGTYALALDADKRPCRVRSSNAGHALFGGIAAPDRAARVASGLMQPMSFSGWGIRTIAAGEARFNPMSYHNGSVWPHDNGLIAMGFARYGLREPLAALFGSLFDVAAALDLKRLPELFCGFARRPGERPTAYPVACLPQAWASAAVFAALGAALGVSFRAEIARVSFTRPLLPQWLDEVRISGLSVGSAEVDMLFRRHGNDVAVNVLHRRGDLQVRILA